MLGGEVDWGGEEQVGEPGNTTGWDDEGEQDWGGEDQ